VALRARVGSPAVPWIQIFAVFVVSHLVGDFILQTQWQARHKRGGLSGPRESQRALAAHTLSYTAAFVPALIWLAGSLGVGVVPAALLIAIPHAVQDDARLLEAYAENVKRMRVSEHRVVMLLLDQSFHIVILFLTALVLAG
jgi:hypothetical protein